MSRHSHAALLGFLLVGCQKETAFQSQERADFVAAEAANVDARQSPDKPIDPSAPLSSCTAANKEGTFVPVGESGNNTLALLRWNGAAGTKTLAIAADEDEKALQIVDVDAHKPLGSTKLSGKPARILITNDGRIIVSLSDVGQLEVFEPAPNTAFPLAHRCSVETPAEPMGLTLTNDKKSLLVATRWEPTLTIYDVANLKKRESIPLPRDPMSVLASTDGKHAFVSHAAGGIISAVDLDKPTDNPESPRTKTLSVTTSQFLAQTHKMPMPQSAVKMPSKTRHTSIKHERIGSQGFVLARNDKNIFAPLVTVEPIPPPGSSSGYGSTESASPAAMSDIVTIDENKTALQLSPSAVNQGPRTCLLPRAAAMDETKHEIFVACLGIDEIIAYDANKDHPHQYEKRRIRVPAGPTGLAVDNENRRAVVFSSFAGEMTFVTLDSPAAKKTKLITPPSTRIKKKKKEESNPDVVSVVLPRTEPVTPEFALGRALFHAAGKRNVALDGRACASCHPDGRDDGLTWQTQEGQRQTPMLMGRLSDDTAPFGWRGDKKTLPSHFKRTLERLSGTGLKNSERDALFAYVKSLSPPTNREDTNDSRVALGKTIFESKETGCSSCHLGDATTDGALHDVISPEEFKIPQDFETPSLRFIARSAPYFHDGRYATLLEMIEGCDGKMGTTRHLDAEKKASLVAYLETL